MLANQWGSLFSPVDIKVREGHKGGLDLISHVLIPIGIYFGITEVGVSDQAGNPVLVYRPPNLCDPIWINYF